ncbi:1-acyl-sn-glycerol-3-phosphate acyltransferase [Dactylosporangium roseum]|uniref:1-acyl-sn-glycerol-3-phosphate acyltransferase n=1 Tax=Dactylosporangium roseum TaxID=47989 RepID=A0ABY5Z4P6_9ACTN|nr:lysophospholipid acyltransferase family protein [Dactylosporangium roseum]UWZ35718.1 1-acyl-sn-glycerol-3-phosphate acyltransferase [Dactylosporangium roseum]
MSALYAIGKMVASPLTRLLWRPKIIGLDNVPLTGPAILASNHQSVIDSVMMGALMPRNVYFLAKDQYFLGPGLKGAVMRQVMYGLNQIPVDRSGGRASLMALDAALPVLRAGHVLGIFPEGTRSTDGRLYRGRPGVAKLALDAPAPIIPIGLIGFDKVQPIGASLPRLGPQVKVRVGEPLDLSQWQGGEVDSRGLREVTLKLMNAIQQLTGQEYVGRYAPKRPDQLADTNGHKGGETSATT